MVDAVDVSLAERPHLVVDGQELLDVFRVDLEDQDLHREALPTDVTELGSHAPGP